MGPSQGGRVPGDPRVTAPQMTAENASLSDEEKANLRAIANDGSTAAQVARDFALKLVVIRAQFAGEHPGEAMLMRKIAGEAFDYWDADEDHKAGKLLMALAGMAPGYRPDLDRLRGLIR